MVLVDGYKGSFLTVFALREAYPVGDSGWYATVGEKQYIWNKTLQIWESKAGSVDWGDITGNLSDQTDLIDYIDSIYIKDYVGAAETLEIRVYENYGLWNPMVNDGVIVNDGTLVIN